MTTPGNPLSLPDLGGRTIVVTGANSGLGLETTRALAARGATVVLACRNLDKASTAMAQLHEVVPHAALEALELDLASLDSVARFAIELGDRHPQVDVLCNNAGVMALPLQKTVDGFERQFGTNHLGHFALTGRLLPLLLAAPAGRVVTVSSLRHQRSPLKCDELANERRYRKWDAYGKSKLANLLFAFELQRRLAARRLPLISLAAHPGYAATNLPFVGPRITGSVLSAAIMTIGNTLFAQSATHGAWPEIYACAAPEVVGGALYGPRGPFELWGRPRRVKLSRGASDLASAQELWDLSVRATGVEFAELASR